MFLPMNLKSILQVVDLSLGSRGRRADHASTYRGAPVRWAETTLAAAPGEDTVTSALKADHRDPASLGIDAERQYPGDAVRHFADAAELEAPLAGPGGGGPERRGTLGTSPSPHRGGVASPCRCGREGPRRIRVHLPPLDGTSARRVPVGADRHSCHVPVDLGSPAYPRFLLAQDKAHDPKPAGSYRDRARGASAQEAEKGALDPNADYSCGSPTASASISCPSLPTPIVVVAIRSGSPRRERTSR